ncbi:MAG: hypothetical protein LBF68_05920 [Christensenellaceae bacterium]|jgi:hypothetical protein|nr:hypothetical protein [Christensenellaceae bacterium]
MDKELLFQFLETTQPEKMEKLRKFYAGKTEKTVINYINREITKSVLTKQKWQESKDDKR